MGNLLWCGVVFVKYYGDGIFTKPLFHQVPEFWIYEGLVCNVFIGGEYFGIKIGFNSVDFTLNLLLKQSGDIIIIRLLTGNKNRDRRRSLGLFWNGSNKS